MRILFMGTPEFSLPSLKLILERGMEVVGVVTGSDRPRGRGLKSSPTPVNEIALEQKLPIFQPLKLSDPDFVGKMRELRPDVISVVAFGGYIPKDLLELPPRGCINLHPSLLPKYRGAAPVNWALIEGEAATGVTTIYMDEGWDTGDIILSSEVAIDPDDTAGTLGDRLAKIGSELLLKTLELVDLGQAPRTPQDNGGATYAPKLAKEDCLIDWRKPALKAHNLVRGLAPHPGAYTVFRGQPLKILRTALWPDGPIEGAGRVVKVIKNEGPVVSCGQGALLIRELQPASRRAMSGGEFIRGYGLEEGYDLSHY